MKIQLQLRSGIQRLTLSVEEYAPASHAEYLALIDQDESFLNASVNPLDSVVDEFAEGMDI